MNILFFIMTNSSTDSEIKSTKNSRNLSVYSVQEELLGKYVNIDIYLYIKFFFINLLVNAYPTLCRLTSIFPLTLSRPGGPRCPLSLKFQLYLKKGS